MRVLIAAGNYPQLSETYISTEIGYFLRRGIEVAVHASAVFTGADLAQTCVFRGSLLGAIKTYKPDVLHSHYLHYTLDRLRSIGNLAIPVTVRSHSYDYSRDDAEMLQQDARVRKIYMFPHFARDFSHLSKVTPLPVAYDTAEYRPHDQKDRTMVLRMSAAKPTKGLGDFFDIASAEIPGYRFVLGMADMGQDPGFFRELSAKRNRAGLVLMKHNVPWPEARTLTHQAGIYLDTSDERGHRFGMPISIAESLATGSFVMAKQSPASEEYLGGVGALYRNVADAIRILMEARIWSDRQWLERWEESVDRSRRYRDDVVLERILSDWVEIVLVREMTNGRTP